MERKKRYVTCRKTNRNRKTGKSDVPQVLTFAGILLLLSIPFYFVKYYSVCSCYNTFYIDGRNELKIDTKDDDGKE